MYGSSITVKCTLPALSGPQPVRYILSMARPGSLMNLAFLSRLLASLISRLSSSSGQGTTEDIDLHPHGCSRLPLSGKPCSSWAGTFMGMAFKRRSLMVVSHAGISIEASSPLQLILLSTTLPYVFHQHGVGIPLGKIFFNLSCMMRLIFPWRQTKGVLPLPLTPCRPQRLFNNLDVAVLAVVIVAGGETESGSGGHRG